MSFGSFIKDTFNATPIGQFVSFCRGDTNEASPEMSPEMKQLVSDLQAKNDEFMIQANEYLNSSSTDTEGTTEGGGNELSPEMSQLLSDMKAKSDEFMIQANEYLNSSSTAIA